MKNFRYRKRWLSYSIEPAVEMMENDVISVITLTGARQVGKTTFVKYESPFSSWDYINLDDLETFALAKKNPDILLTRSRYLVIDEIQRAPELLLKIKLLADSGKHKFLLTGSANLLLMKGVSESLAGRSIIFMLTPFALREWDEIGSGILLKFARDGIEPRDRIVSSSYDVKERMTKGSMPATFLLKRGARLWWNSYIRTYLERDLRDLSSISNLADFHRLLEVIAYMGANLLEESTVARNIGISVPTAHRWINILETSLILYKLRPYLKGKISRIRKTPKVYFIDPALTFHLMKSEPTQKDWGRLFENLVFLQLLAMTNSFGGELYYWRTLGGTEREVDFVWEYENRVIAIEAKFKEEVSIKDAQNLIYFCENNTCDGGFIAYSGNRVHKLLSNIWVVPIGEL